MKTLLCRNIVEVYALVSGLLREEVCILLVIYYFQTNRIQDVEGSFIEYVEGLTYELSSSYVCLESWTSSSMYSVKFPIIKTSPEHSLVELVIA